MAGFIFKVTARAEQIPSICTVTGFCKLRGTFRRLKFFDEKMLIVDLFRIIADFQ
jgi:hypothetical protein